MTPEMLLQLVMVVKRGDCMGTATDHIDITRDCDKILVLVVVVE